MDGYIGYALQAGVSGFQTGFNMAQQKQEMEWKKAQMKKLEEKEKKIADGAANYSNLIKQYGADGVYSEDEIMQLNTAFLSAGYEVQSVIKDTHNAIQTMDKNKLEQDLTWLGLFADMTEGLDPKDVQGAFDIVKGTIKSEKGMNLLEAYGNLQTKKYEVTEKERELEITKYLPEEYRYPHLKEAGIVGEITPTVKPETISAADAKLNFAISSYNAGKITFDELSKYMGTYIAQEKATALEGKIEEARKVGATDEQIKSMILGKPTPEPELKPETVTTLKSWEIMFDIKTEEGPKTEEEYNRALELLRQSEDVYKPKYATWKEALIAEAKGIAKELKGITDKEDFNLLVGIYMQKLEEIKSKYPEVNLDQFPEFEEQKNWFEKLKEKVGL